MGIRLVSRLLRFALAMALAIAGVAMVSHHASDTGHATVAHAHEMPELTDTAASSVQHHDHDGAGAAESSDGLSLASGCSECDLSGHEAFLMGCAALLTALLASVRIAAPSGGLLASAPAPVALSSVGPATAAIPDPPRQEELSVLRQ